MATVYVPTFLGPDHDILQVMFPSPPRYVVMASVGATRGIYRVENSLRRARSRFRKLDPSSLRAVYFVSGSLLFLVTGLH